MNKLDNAFIQIEKAAKNLLAAETRGELEVRLIIAILEDVLKEHKKQQATEVNANQPNICKKCGGSGEVDYYHDAGDHFGANKAPYSEWRKRPCDKCLGGFIQD